MEEGTAVSAGTEGDGAAREEVRRAKNARMRFAEDKVGAIMTAPAHGWAVDKTVAVA